MSLLSDVRIGNQTPTLLHLPGDREDARRADDLLEVADIAGLKLDQAQEMILRGSAWMHRRGGRLKWSAPTVLVDEPRQNGKGTPKLVRQLTGLFVWSERLQIHTAHLYPTCYEHFLKLRDIMENVPSFTRQLKPRTGVTSGSQNQGMELRNGARIKFMARSGGSGRGLTSDTVYLDEAFAVAPAMVGALEYAMRAKPNPQVWYTSSAPHLASQVMHGLRRQARLSTDEEPRLFAACWNNEPGIDPGDREAWYRVNPALGIRIDVETMEGEYRKAVMDPDLMREFMREALGIPEGGDEAPYSVIPLVTWQSAQTDRDAPEQNIALGIDIESDLSLRVVVSGKGREQVAELVDGANLAAVAEIARRYRATVLVDGTSPAEAFVPELEQMGATVKVLPASDVADACQVLYADLADGRIKIRSCTLLDEAAARAQRHSVGDKWRWLRRDGVPAAPLVALTLAHWGSTRAKRKPIFAY